MGWLTPCNHCNLRWLRQAAEAAGKVVTMLPGTEPIAGDLGVQVYVHAPGEAPSDANWKAWFMALGDRCECSAPEGDARDDELLAWAESDPEFARLMRRGS